MSAELDPVTLMKQQVGEAAAAMVQSGSIVGLGTGSTAAFMIRSLGDRLKSGELKDVKGVTTSFQGEVLARECGIPLITMDEIDSIDIAIDGADEVDPDLNLIKGGGAAHFQEKLVERFSKKFVVIVDSSKLVDKLNLNFLLPVEVVPKALNPVTKAIEKMGGKTHLRMGVKKSGPVVTDQGNLILDVKFTNGIENPVELEQALNNIPGVLENGLFVNMTDLVLVGDVIDGVPSVREIKR
mgnify:CR=1 FL=1